MVLRSKEVFFREGVFRVQNGHGGEGSGVVEVAVLVQVRIQHTGKPDQVPKPREDSGAEQVVLPSVFVILWRPGIQELFAV